MKIVLFVLLSFFSIDLVGQDSLIIVKQKKIELTSSLDRMSNALSPTTPSILKQRSIYKVKSLPIFCKIEHKLAKSSNINVMMRLGSLDYVDKLEGKKP